MKNDLKTELNKKHTTHVNRIKENHMKDIKHLKVEMKNLLIIYNIIFNIVYNVVYDITYNMLNTS